MKVIAETYLRFDAYLLRCAQESYLYLYDRIGIYVATLAMIFYTPIVALSFADHPVMNGIMFLIVALSLGRGYYLQDKRDYASFNAVAEQMRNMSIRHPMQIAMLLAIPVPFVSMEIFWILASISTYIYTYLLLVKIRDRDKKPLFEKKQEVATQQV